MTDTRKTATLRYNPEWMDKTFTSKSVTEALLSPERESGNITSHDYEATVNFFSNHHRRYHIIGLFAGGLSVYAIPNRKWTQLQRSARVGIGAIVGSLVGGGFVLLSHANFVRSLEKPFGFQRALEHVQAQVGAPRRSASIIVKGRPDDLDQDEQGPTLILPSASDSQQTSQPTQSSRTRWDELRDANNRKAQNSTWDTIRQQHERKGVSPPPKADGTSLPDSTAASIDTDRYANRDDGDKYSESQQGGRPRRF